MEEPIVAADALRHLARPEQARQPETHQLLRAGMERVLAPMQLRTSDPGVAVPDLRWPTRDEVVARFNQTTGQAKSKRVFDYRWETLADYHADLIAWALHPAQWEQHDVVAADLAGTGPGPTPAELVAELRALAARDVRATLSEDSFLLQLVLLAVAPAHPVVREELGRTYGRVDDRWEGPFAALLATRGLRVRAGATVSTMMTVLTAVEEGLVMRYLGDPGEFDHSVERLSEVCADGILAAFASFVEPDDGSPGVPLDAWVASRLTGARADGAPGS